MNKRKPGHDDDDSFPSTLALPLDAMGRRLESSTPAPATRPAAPRPQTSRFAPRAALPPELAAKYALSSSGAAASGSASRSRVAAAEPVPLPSSVRADRNSKFAALEPQAAPRTVAKTRNSKFAALEPEPAPRAVAKTRNSKFDSLESEPAPRIVAKTRHSKFAAFDAAPTPSAVRAARNSKFAGLDAEPAARAAPVSASPAATRPSEPSETPALRLVVRGFSAVERSLLDGTVKLSQRRTPRLTLLADSDVDSADVVMINALDARAMDWAQRQTSLAGKAVIWVDGKKAAPGHTLAKRPVQWPILPILLARALEQGPGTQSASASAAKGRAGASAASEAPSAATTVAAAAPEHAGPRQILVVDDSLAVRAHLKSQLEGRGYQVSEAEHVEGALEAVSCATFACVLMDVLMPGVDGYEGCKQIKAKLRGALSVPVIMLTSKSSPFDRIRGKMAGCDAYLTKPVQTKQLHDTLAQCIAPAGAQGAANAETPSAAAPRAARRTRPAPLELHDAVEQ
jgi:two-component system, cell cycle response regulator